MFTLKMVMELVDQVSKPVSKIGKSINTLSRNTGLDKVGKGFADLNGPVRTSVRELFTFGRTVAFAGAAATGALFALTKSTATYSDQLVKTADRLGVNIESLQRLRWAAELSGVGTQTFDTALQRFTRRTAEAAAGTGVAKDALMALGIELKDKATGNLRPAEELLGEVADKMAQIEDPAKRVRLAFTLFDTEGVKMINMLKDGRQALLEAAKEAESFGLITEEQARQAETFNDNMSRLSKMLTHIGYAVGNDLMPYFNDFVLVLKDVAVAARPHIIAWLKDTIELLGSVVGFVSRQWTGLVEQIGLLQSAAVAGGSGLLGLVGKLALFIQQIGTGRAVTGALLTVVGIKLVTALFGLIKPLGLLIWYSGVAAVKITLLAGRAALAAGRFLFGLAPALWAGSKAALKFAASGVAAAIRGLIALAPSILGATVAAWGFAAALLANPITWVVAGLAALVAAALWLWRNWDQVSAWLAGAWQTIKTTFSAMMEGLIEALASFNPLTLIAKAVNSMIEYLFGIDLGAVGMKWINSLSEGITEALAGAGDLLGGLARSATDFLGFGDDEGPEEAAQQKRRGRTAPLAPARPSALSRETVDGAIVVRFENMPENGRVNSEARGPVSLDTEVAYAGRSMSGY